MKKFKLIKEYPGSPKLGTIIEEYGAMYFIYKDDEKINHEVYIHRTLVLSFPEYWEPTSDFKILSFEYSKWDDDAKLNESGKYELECGAEWDLETLLNVGVCVNNGHIKIKSLKRLSDNTIFTIGDKINHMNRVWENCYINSFEIRDGVMYVKNSSAGAHPIIEIIIDNKKPLFKTDDDVEIFEGDSYFFIMDNRIIEIDEADKSQDRKIDGYPDFSTREAAEEHLMLNKNCLSLNDVFKNIPKLSDRLKDILITFVKENK